MAKILAFLWCSPLTPSHHHHLSPLILHTEAEGGTQAHTFMHAGTLGSPINLTRVSVDCGRKPEYVERTCVGTVGGGTTDSLLVLHCQEATLSFCEGFVPVMKWSISLLGLKGSAVLNYRGSHSGYWLCSRQNVSLSRCRRRCHERFLSAASPWEHAGVRPLVVIRPFLITEWGRLSRRLAPRPQLSGEGCRRGGGPSCHRANRELVLFWRKDPLMEWRFSLSSSDAWAEREIDSVNRVKGGICCFVCYLFPSEEERSTCTWSLQRPILTF